MSVVERPFSEFLRHPTDVVAELADHDVLLRRRNAPALRLSRADREDDRAGAFEVLARLLRNLAVQSPELLGGAVDEAFEWVTFLPETDRELFIDELTQTLVGAAAVENFAPVAQLQREWKSTAEVHADPALSRRLRPAIDADGGVVPSQTG